MKGNILFIKVCLISTAMILGGYHCGNTFDGKHNYKIIIQPEGYWITATSGSIAYFTFYIDLTDDNNPVPNAGINLRSSVGPPRIELIDPIKNVSSSPLIVTTDGDGSTQFTAKTSVDSNYTAVITSSYGVASTVSTVNVQAQ